MRQITKDKFNEDKVKASFNLLRLNDVISNMDFTLENDREIHKILEYLSLNYGIK